MSFSEILRMVFPPKTDYTGDNIPDLTGKVALVTGGNKGIGKEICHQLMRKNAKVYMAARDLTAADKAVDELEQLTGKKASVLPIDLSDFESVKSAANKFLEQEKRLDILFNNAGILQADATKLSKQGYELTLAVNTMSPYLLTRLLLPTLQSTAATTGAPSRMVWTISAAPFFYKPGKLLPETFRLESRGNPPLGGNMMYAQSKSAATMLAQNLAKQLKKDDGEVFILSIDPGGIDTDLFHETLRIRQWLQKKLLLSPIWKGALTPLYAGTASDVKTGQMYFPFARLGFFAEFTKDEKEQKKFASWCDEQIAPWL
ncbi:hypothetical protein IAR55_003601 [Kwoniella newhampshirensis]|uniref:Short-chain dehydrogenase n=1 Tax=Kwoniella newhampshirensis TaxID=1651941 RepID=A0AAW0YZG7_9TREE